MWWNLKHVFVCGLGDPGVFSLLVVRIGNAGEYQTRGTVRTHCGQQRSQRAAALRIEGFEFVDGATGWSSPGRRRKGDTPPLCRAKKCARNEDSALKTRQKKTITRERERRTRGRRVLGRGQTRWKPALSPAGTRIVAYCWQEGMSSKGGLGLSGRGGGPLSRDGSGTGGSRGVGLKGDVG